MLLVGINACDTFLTIAIELRGVLDRNIEHLSGGELQRFAIGLTACQRADM